jgi:HK97 gp10 family phage protein
MKITGVKEFEKKLKDMPAEIRKEIRGALQKSSEEIVPAMKHTVPRRSGDLAKSIGSTFGSFKASNPNVRGILDKRKRSADPDLSLTIHAGDKKAWYAALVEFGTVKTKAQPFFLPVWRAYRKRAVSRVKRATSKAIKKVFGGK